MNKTIYNFVKYMLYFLFGLTIIVWITTPWLLEFYFELIFRYDINADAVSYLRFMKAFVLICGLFLMIVLWNMIKFVNTLTTEPFIKENEKRLKQISLSLFAISLVFLVKCAYLPSPMSLACLIFLVTAAAFVSLLKVLFSGAVDYKVESDFTI